MREKTEGPRRLATDPRAKDEQDCHHCGTLLQFQQALANADGEISRLPIEDQIQRYRGLAFIALDELCDLLNPHIHNSS